MSAFQERKRVRDELILKLAKQGVSTKNIARQVRVSAKLVQKIRHEAGLSAAHVVWTPELVERAQKLIADGVPAPEIDRTLRIRRGATRDKFPESTWSAQQRAEFENDCGTRQRVKPILRRPSFLATEFEKPLPAPRPGTPFS